MNKAIPVCDNLNKQNNVCIHISGSDRRGVNDLMGRSQEPGWFPFYFPMENIIAMGK